MPRSVPKSEWLEGCFDYENPRVAEETDGIVRYGSRKQSSGKSATTSKVKKEQKTTMKPARISVPDTTPSTGGDKAPLDYKFSDKERRRWRQETRTIAVGPIKTLGWSIGAEDVKQLLRRMEWLALTNKETALEDDAVGLSYEGDTLRAIAIAIVNPFEELPGPALRELWEKSISSVIDTYGLIKRDICKFQNNCKRPDCPYYHYGDPDVWRFFPGSSRSCPNHLRSGFYTFSAKRAVILLVNPNDTSERCLVAGSKVELDKKISSIDDLEERHRRDLNKFCLKVAAVNTSDFQAYKAKVSGEKEDPNLSLHLDKEGERLHIVKSNSGERRFMDEKRFLTEVTCEFFNHAAAEYLFDCGGKQGLAYRLDSKHPLQDPLPPPYAVLPSTDLIPRRSYKKVSLNVRNFDDYLSLCDGTVDYFKFNSPMRDFSCLYNLGQLVVALSEHPSFLGKISNVIDDEKYTQRFLEVPGRWKKCVDLEAKMQRGVTDPNEYYLPSVIPPPRLDYSSLFVCAPKGPLNSVSLKAKGRVTK